MRRINRTPYLVRGVVHALLCLAVVLAAATAHAHPGHDHSHPDGAGAFFSPATSKPSTSSTASAKPASALNAIAANQVQLTEVFSQDSIRESAANPFGSGIRVDFNDVIELGRDDLVNINTQQQQEDLFNLFGNGVASPFSDVLNVFFVDSISACGESTGAGIVGCGSINGNDLVVETAFAEGPLAAELLAHEIGHNLGLFHVGNNSSTDNLLNPVLNGNTSLTASQATSLINNSRVNNDFINNELFITINPIVVGSLPVLLAETIPEPTSVVILLVGVALLVSRRRPHVDGRWP